MDEFVMNFDLKRNRINREQTPVGCFLLPPPRWTKNGVSLKYTELKRQIETMGDATVNRRISVKLYVSLLALLCSLSTIVEGISRRGAIPTAETDLDYGTQLLRVLVEVCPGMGEEIADEMDCILTDHNVSDWLIKIPCNDPVTLTQSAGVALSRLGVVHLVAVATWPTVQFLRASPRMLTRGSSLDTIIMDDSLMLRQWAGNNWVANFVDTLLTRWLWSWKTTHLYFDEQYADNMEANIHAFGKQSTDKEGRSTQMRMASKTSPQQLLQELLDDVEGNVNIRSIVTAVDVPTTLRLMQLASSENMLTARQQWLIFYNGLLTDLLTKIQLQVDSMVFIVRHTGKIQDLVTLTSEYLKSQPQMVELGATSTFLDNSTRPEWSEKLTPANRMENSIGLEVLQLYSAKENVNSYQKVAEWNPGEGLFYSHISRFVNYHQKVVRVAVLESPPYVFIADESTDFRFSGYMVDVLMIVANLMNFTVEFVLADNFAEVNGSFNGVIDLLLKKEADVGLLDMAVTSDRLRLIDFSDVSLDFQSVAGMYRRPGTDGDGMDKFGVYLEPFHLYVWIASILVLVLLIAALHVSLWLTDKYGGTMAQAWENDSLSVSRGILLGFQAVAQQGCELNFGNPSTRIVFVVLWVFALIAYASYSATLMSYLTVTKVIEPFETLSDLAKNREFRIGLLAGTNLLEMFASSSTTVYRAIWRRIEEEKYSTVLPDFATGLQRAHQEKFVFLADDKTLQYYARNTCDFKVSAALTKPQMATVSFQKLSPYKRSISRVLRSLNDAGVLYRLRHKWWGDGLFCESESQDFVSLSLTNVATGFLLLVGGIIFCLVGLALEKAITGCGKMNSSSKLPDVTQDLPTKFHHRSIPPLHGPRMQKRLQLFF